MYRFGQHMPVNIYVHKYLCPPAHRRISYQKACGYKIWDRNLKLPTDLISFQANIWKSRRLNQFALNDVFGIPYSLSSDNF